jgi:DNA-binding phage protein
VVHRFIHGMANPSMPTIDAICETLGLRLIADDKPGKKKGGK